MNFINSINNHEVRELAPEQFWWWKVKIIDFDKFNQAIEESVKETGFTYSGFISGGEYTMTRYPRRAFWPVAAIDVYKNALQTLANKLWVEAEEETFDLFHPTIRVLLWLEEWYEEYQKRNLMKQIENDEFNIENTKLAITNLLKENWMQNIQNMSWADIYQLLSDLNLSKTHSLEEVKSYLWEEFSINDAKIFTVWWRGQYSEPAVIIYWPKDKKSQIYKLVENFRQARIAVEDLWKWEAYMVETKYCEDPDKE